MSEDGRITIRGRIKDLIIRGGENIYPPEIESLLYTHSDVLEVQDANFLSVSGLDDAGCGSPRLEAGGGGVCLDHTKTWEIPKRRRRQRLLQGQDQLFQDSEIRAICGIFPEDGVRKDT
ncbi:unnamed protein product, partial [Ixodes persulcatus]